MLKNLNQLKKWLEDDRARIKLIEAPTMPDHKYLGIERKVSSLQSNSVKLTCELGNSWLYFEKASDFSFCNDNTFWVVENNIPLLKYEYYLA